ncbi:uncharacterized protein LOC114267023 [Camellia sinensis]|uniref:uncharacterized protein LOC114267023 n=1 Tax=Camellia sinensis TaxID=4442 RepID=UPI001036070C|nr:uncharacterized protein LOC114267023 [Camellia sinensis]
MIVFPLFNFKDLHEIGVQIDDAIKQGIIVEGWGHFESGGPTKSIGVGSMNLGDNVTSSMMGDEPLADGMHFTPDIVDENYQNILFFSISFFSLLRRPNQQLLLPPPPPPPVTSPMVIDMFLGQVRGILAQLGYEKLDEIIGRTDLLGPRDVSLMKTQHLDLSYILSCVGLPKWSSTRIRLQDVHSNSPVLDDILLSDPKRGRLKSRSQWWLEEERARGRG